MKQQSKIKEVILREALDLFNTHGYVNVRLQHIADKAGVSVGNMAYHYKNKEAILYSIYERLKARQQLHMTEFRIVPLFEDIDRQIKSA